MTDHLHDAPATYVATRKVLDNVLVRLYRVGAAEGFVDQVSKEGHIVYTSKVRPWKDAVMLWRL